MTEGISRTVINDYKRRYTFGTGIILRRELKDSASYLSWIR